MLFWTRIAVPLSFVIIVIFSCASHTPVRAINDHQRDTDVSSLLPKLRLSVNDLRLLVEVMQSIQSTYVDPVDNKMLIRNAIKGMIERLDEHSVFLSPDKLDKLREHASGRFAGIGIQADIKSDAIHVINIFPNTPAKRAGMVAGDIITHLEDIAISDLTEHEVASQMRGMPGTEIALTLLKKNQTMPVKINLSREIIFIDSISSKIVENEYGYIRIKQFQTTTGEELQQHLIQLEKQYQLKGIILDLRDNPGGTLQSAIEVADLFIDRGTIVYTKGRISGSDMEFRSSRLDITNGLPIAVIINENSASAAEIVAGALKDHGRAIVVGKRSYGKGSVQSIIPFNGIENAGMKLTTARYYTPSGKSIQSTGILPDLKVSNKSIGQNNKKTDTLISDIQLLKAVSVIANMVDY